MIFAKKDLTTHLCFFAKQEDRFTEIEKEACSLYKTSPDAHGVKVKQCSHCCQHLKGLSRKENRRSVNSRNRTFVQITL